jgi:hypothetical protein
VEAPNGILIHKEHLLRQLSRERLMLLLKRLARFVANAWHKDSASVRVPSLPDKYYTAEQIEVIREPGGSFRVRSIDDVVLSLSLAAATQIHRFTAPYKRCACRCRKDDGVLVHYETKTNLPGNQVFVVKDDLVAIRDNYSATLVLNGPAVQKVHVLLRPSSCTCGCIERGHP